MKSTYSNTKMDEKESSVLDNVDIMYSILGGNAPPVLPLREERQTDGFEMVYNAKGIGNSAVLKEKNRKEIELERKLERKLRRMKRNFERKPSTHRPSRKLKMALATINDLKFQLENSTSGISYDAYLEELQTRMRQNIEMSPSDGRETKSQVISAPENLLDDTDVNLTLDKDRYTPNMPNDTNDVMQSLNRTISDITYKSDLADEQEFNSVDSQDKIGDLIDQMSKVPLREERQTDVIELVVSNDTKADKYLITNCLEQRDATSEILETSKLVYLEESWNTKKVTGKSNLNGNPSLAICGSTRIHQRQGNTFMKETTGSKSSNDFNKKNDENLYHHEEISCDLSIESETLQSLNSIRTGKTKHHYGYKCMGENSKEYEELAKKTNMSFESKRSYNSTNDLNGINADIESDLSENSIVNDCRYRNISTSNRGDQMLSFDSLHAGIAEEAKDRIVANRITCKITQIERADRNVDSKPVSPFIENTKSSLNIDEADSIFSTEDSCRSLHCIDSSRIATYPKIDDIKQFAAQKSDMDVASNDISRMQHNNVAETDDMISASHSVEITDKSKPEIEKDHSRKCTLNRSYSADDQNIESLSGSDTIPRETDITEERGSSLAGTHRRYIQINQQARDDDTSQYSQKTWNSKPNFFKKHIPPTRIEKTMSKKNEKETNTQLLSTETHIVQGIKSQSKGYKMQRHRPSVKSMKSWEPRKNDFLMPQAQFGIQVFRSASINSGEIHL
jgi:hypothetical protein